MFSAMSAKLSPLETTLRLRGLAKKLGAAIDRCADPDTAIRLAPGVLGALFLVSPTQPAAVPHQEVDVIRGHVVVQHAQAVALAGLIQPPNPRAPVARKPEQKLFAMAAVGDVVHPVVQMKTMASRHTAPH
jgi:hypothetical protein